MLGDGRPQLSGRGWVPWLGALVALAALGAAGVLVYRHYAASPDGGVLALVSALPGDATTVIYVDAGALRQSPFFARLLELAPAQQVDREYAEFLRATGFQYERDLDRAAIAIRHSSTQKNFVAIVEGRFDRGKITEHAAAAGTRAVSDGREIYSTPVSGSARRMTFTFLRANRMALTDDESLTEYLKTQKDDAGAELRERVVRLAGSPFFVILRQEALGALPKHPPAPGGVRIDQLAAIAANLRWVTVAARPEGERLKLVVEGECASDDAARRIAESLDGLLTLARMGTDDPKARKEMDPATREALGETLKSAEVSRIDRGETKAVRLVVDFGPKILDAMQNSGE